MHNLIYLTRNGLMAATLFAVPVFAQSDPNRPADISTTSRAEDSHNDGFDMGWLGLVGLAGLAGLRRKAPETVTHTSDGNAARVYPSKA